MLNVTDALEGKSAEWHKLYSLGGTNVLGYITTRCTLALMGMGASERAWSSQRRLNLVHTITSRGKQLRNSQSFPHHIR